MPFHLSEKISLCATIVRVCVRDEEPSFPSSTVEVRRSVEDYSLQSGGNRTNKGATSVIGKVSHQIGWNWQCISSSRDPFHPFFSSRPSRVEIVAGHTRGEVDSGALTSGLPEYHEEISHKETEKHSSYSHHSGVIWRLKGGKKDSNQQLLPVSGSKWHQTRTDFSHHSCHFANRTVGQMGCKEKAYLVLANRYTETVLPRGGAAAAVISAGAPTTRTYVYVQSPEEGTVSSFVELMFPTEHAQLIQHHLYTHMYA